MILTKNLYPIDMTAMVLFYSVENTEEMSIEIQAKTSKSGRECFRLGAESHSSLGRVGKKIRK